MSYILQVVEDADQRAVSGRKKKTLTITHPCWMYISGKQKQCTVLSSD